MDIFTCQKCYFVNKRPYDPNLQLNFDLKKMDMRWKTDCLKHACLNGHWECFIKLVENNTLLCEANIFYCVFSKKEGTNKRKIFDYLLPHMSVETLNFTDNKKFRYDLLFYANESDRVDNYYIKKLIEYGVSNQFE